MHLLLRLVVLCAGVLLAAGQLSCTQQTLTAMQGSTSNVTGTYCASSINSKWNICGPGTDPNSTTIEGTWFSTIQTMNQATCVGWATQFCTAIGATGGQENQNFCCQMASMCYSDDGCAGVTTATLPIIQCCDNCLMMPNIYGCSNVNDTLLRNYCAYHCANPPCLYSAAVLQSEPMWVMMAIVVILVIAL